MRYAPGTTATLTATVVETDGDLVDPDSILVSVYDRDGTLVIDNEVPNHISTGLYSYDLVIAADAKKGLWRIEWRLVIDGHSAFAVEYFEVYDIGDPSPSETNFYTNSILRSRLAESKIDPLGDGSDTLFTDLQINMIYTLAGENIDRATLEGWRWKMAYYVQLIDVTESGSNRTMSQKFKQAKEMVDSWRAFLDDQEDDLAAAMAGRVVGRVIDLRGTKCKNSSNPYPFSGYADHVRIFPLHRLIIPAILS